MSRAWHQENISFAFNDQHRNGPDWYRWLDIDTAYYRDPAGGDLYLFEEQICVKKDGIEIDSNIPARYPLEEHKRNTLQELSDLTDIPAYVCWHRPSCNRFAVRRLGADDVRVLNGWSEYWDWLDEYRLEGGEGLY